jgi:hypothetical protein
VRKLEDQEQITLRLPKHLLKLAETEAERLAPLVQSRSDILRMAIERGMKAVQKIKIGE